MQQKIKSLFQQKKEWKIVIYCLVLAFAFLSLCSRSSFLYPCNNWDDANSYFSMGKFLVNGNVIYQNLFDQKGPYLYLLYGIAYLISHDTFFGVFLMEILAITVFLYAGYLIMTLMCSKNCALLILPLVAMGTLSSLSFYWGGAAEEFCLPLLAISLYMSMRYWKEEYPKAPGWKLIVINGIFAGIVAQVKFNMLGFYFAWMAVMALFNLSKEKWRHTIANCVLFLGGMFLTMIPWLIYFGIHGALVDWYESYIYYNVFIYSDLNADTLSGGGIGAKVYDLTKILLNLVRDNFSYFGFIVIGFLGILMNLKNKWYEKINLIALFGFLFIGIFIGGSNIFYYSIPLMTFTSLGTGVLGSWIDWFIRKMNWKEENKRQWQTWLPLGCTVACILGLLGTWNLSMNIEYRKETKETHFLYHFKDIVKQEETPTLLNINMLDAGLYTVADIMPTCKYFQTSCGLALNKMYEEQERYIKEGETQFIISRFDYPDYILEKYELVAEESFATNGKEETFYFLFKRKE